jgi:iron complex outermembrane receptor protein
VRCRTPRVISGARKASTHSPAGAGDGRHRGPRGATPPLDKDRTVNAIFGELLIPIVKDLEGNAAIRYDDYNDVGSTTNYF